MTQGERGFNTSHVKVNLTNNIIKQHDPVSFNTSHVKVNHRRIE